MQPSLVGQLEQAVKGGSADRRIAALRRVTDLFLENADRFSDAQIDVFDDVLCFLIEKIETGALAELSVRLAPIQAAPTKVIRRLAQHDEITVAGPVLSQSPRLTSSDLIEIAKTKSQEHLLAIADRTHLEKELTDQLLRRGQDEVFNRLAKNSGAQFTDAGFEKLINRAATNEDLAKNIGMRLDLPSRLLGELLLIATEAVRCWLLLHATSSETKAEIRRVISAVSGKVSREVTAPRDYSRAQEIVEFMQRQNKLDEAALQNFANAQRYEETVATLATLASTSLQTVVAVMRSDRYDGVLVVCKAADLRWPTVKAILSHRFAHHHVPDDELVQAEADYRILSQATAIRTLRFWKARNIKTRDS